MKERIGEKKKRKSEKSNKLENVLENRLYISQWFIIFMRVYRQ
jgi:hypothetical protein